MGLPKVKYPTYKLTIPSTGKSVKYRPFTVSEERILLTAIQGEDVGEMLHATEEIIKACFTDIGDVSELASYDVEYMFVNLRSKSVSNIVEMKFRHAECPANDGKPSEYVANVQINLDQAKVQILKDGEYVDYVPDNKSGKGIAVKLEDDLGVTMKHPGLETLVKISDDATVIDEVVKDCIVVVYDDEEVYDTFTRDELDEFYQSLTTKHKEKLMDFVSNIPKLRYESSFLCKACGYEEPIVFEGFQSFFN